MDDNEDLQARTGGARKWLHLALCILAGIALQIVIGAFVSSIQGWTMLAGFHSTSIDTSSLPLIWVLGIPFNTGGLTVRVVFEVLATGRSSTVMSHLALYAPLLLLQIVVVGLVIGRHLHRRRTWKDVHLAIIAALLVLNSLLNLAWPWWGT